MAELNVKAGDKVFVVTRYAKKIYIVERVTPTGRIKVNDSYYDRKGHLMGSHNIWNNSRIEIATEEAIEEYKKSQYIMKVKDKMNSYKECLTYEEAVIINEILNKHIKQGGNWNVNS